MITPLHSRKIRSISILWYHTIISLERNTHETLVQKNRRVEGGGRRISPFGVMTKEEKKMLSHLLVKIWRVAFQNEGGNALGEEPFCMGSHWLNIAISDLLKDRDESRIRVVHHSIYRADLVVKETTRAHELSLSYG